MKAYHFLKDDMCGGYGNEPAWEVGEERDIGDDDLILCQRGYHSSPSWYDALGYARGNMACIVKVSKPVGKDDTKQVSRKRKLIKAVNVENVLREWACDCAERALKRAKVKDERSWNAITAARMYNEGYATREDLDAARAAAWAAERVAAWDAARDAARAAAWAAERVAAWDAAWDAARDAARAAEIRWQKQHLNKLMKELFND